ncbi:putative dehydrogenase [Salana multivorans]|uniref:Putative dehydrogenase n=1 Tax=Salana multivorans TaxID=120377 RepID=A0A3N2D9E5_9MICO|nr:Gfo/Idh/MocA family oxidoreductase [Salana multivorans]ROR96400.1 putative dehydrogenase [Salana multivorans]
MSRSSRTGDAIRVGVLGFGRWGRTWLPVLEAEPDVEVVAVAGGLSGATGPSGASSHPTLRTGVRHVGRWEDALDDLDAVLVTLPVPLHLAAAREAAARGLHVLLEKPAVLARGELAALEDVAARAPGVVMVCQNYRERPWARRVRVELTTLGPLTHVTVEIARRELLDGGRGALAHPLLDDLAIHHVDLLRHLTGQEAEVLAATSSRPPWTSYDGTPDAAALLRLSGGATVAMHGTWAARGRETPYDGDWTFRGERGLVEVRDLAVLRDDQVVAPARAVTPGVHDDTDLADVLRTFLAGIAGVPVLTDVAEHARSLRLLLDLRDATGLPPLGDAT